MKKDRRTFIRTVGYAGVSLIGLRSFGLDELPRKERKRFTILHTNDMHSHVDPFDMDDRKYPGLGGMAQRATLVKQERLLDPELMLLDSGDVFQGTPYFNFFGGSLELQLMSEMGYDASTIGNHEFDGGMDGFLKAQESADFPFINSNYDVIDTPWENALVQQQVFVRNGVRIGVFGLGVELDGLVDPRLYGDVRYLDPVSHAKFRADSLRIDDGCEIVICLSHLGYDYKTSKVSDRMLAENVSGIDLILGGHTHTFLPAPVTIRRKDGWQTIINQVGWAGVRLGKLSIDYFPELRQKRIHAEVMDIRESRS